jgi:hypothetical protein
MCVCIYIQARNAYVQNIGKEINTQARVLDHLHNPTQRHHHRCLICNTCNKPLSIIIKVIELNYHIYNIQFSHTIKASHIYSFLRSGTCLQSSRSLTKFLLFMILPVILLNFRAYIPMGYHELLYSVTTLWPKEISHKVCELFRFTT